MKIVRRRWGKTATFLVAANDANASVISSADYVCDGTADDVQINAAIQALPAGGGKVVLSEGKFVITAAIDIDTSNTSLEGQGPATELESSATGSISVVALGNDVDSCTVRDMEIDCNWQSNNVGLDLKGVRYSRFDNILFTAAPVGIKMTSPGSNHCSQNTFSHIFISSCVKGVTMSGNSNSLPCTFNTFMHLEIFPAANNSTSHGVDFIQNADNNFFYLTRIVIAADATYTLTGIQYNSGDAGNNNNVYENNFYRVIIDMSAGGGGGGTNQSVVVNKTERQSVMELRIGGADASDPVLNAGARLHILPGSLLSSDKPLNGGTANTGVTPIEQGNGYSQTTILTVSQVNALTLADNASIADGYLLYTFPAGTVVIDYAYMTMAVQAAGAQLINDTPDVGLGTVIGTGAVATLDGTAEFEDIITGQTATDADGTATVKTALPTAAVPFVIESGDAHTLHFNVADAWADDTGGDLTADIAGTVVIVWRFLA